MYLQQVTIRNIKCFEEISLNFQQPDGTIRQWNVLIGENGTGKTTLLQAIAIALAGEKAASVLLPRPRGWVRNGASQGEIEAVLVPTSLDVETTWGKSGGAQLGKPLHAKYAIIESSDDQLDSGPTIVEQAGADRERLRGIQRHSPLRLGWFAAGYGPFRRLSGGSEQAAKVAEGNTRESRFITLFWEDAALTDCEQWLQELDYQRLDADDQERQQHSEALLRSVRGTINTYLLPEDVQLEEINSQGVFFRTPYAQRVRMGSLSDGYRAMLALGVDLLRHLSQTYFDTLSPASADWLRHVTGVVLIDELDAHLHPTWQRQISFWLKNRFPGLQFIVATHSPFVPQAAEEGGIFVLREPESTANAVQAFVDEPSVRGWRADQILTILFDTPGMYAPDTEERLRQYARLKILDEMGQLPPDQTQTFADLQAWVDGQLAPPGDTREEMAYFRDVQRRAEAVSHLLREQHDQG